MRRSLIAAGLVVAAAGTSVAAQGVAESLYTAHQVYQWWKTHNPDISKAIGGSGEGMKPIEPARPLHFANLSDQPVSFNVWSKRCRRARTYTIQPHSGLHHACVNRKGERYYWVSYNGRTAMPVGYSLLVFERSTTNVVEMVDRSGPERAELIRRSHAIWGGTG